MQATCRLQLTRPPRPPTAEQPPAWRPASWLQPRPLAPCATLKVNAAASLSVKNNEWASVGRAMSRMRSTDIQLSAKRARRSLGASNCRSVGQWLGCWASYSAVGSRAKYHFASFLICTTHEAGWRDGPRLADTSVARCRASAFPACVCPNVSWVPISRCLASGCRFHSSWCAWDSLKALWRQNNFRDTQGTGAAARAQKAVV
jgi:hypothetical protein